MDTKTCEYATEIIMLMRQQASELVQSVSTMTKHGVIAWPPGHFSSRTWQSGMIKDDCSFAILQQSCGF